MPLVSMKVLLEDARKSKRAVGAFNIANMEILMGVIKAAEFSNTPIIIQAAEKRLKHSPAHLVFPMAVSAAKKSKVDVAVQLDHGESFDLIEEVIGYGATSIMYDGSSLPLEENIKNTNRVWGLVKDKGISLEAEIGVLSGNEGAGEMQGVCSDIGETREFCKKAKFNALAISIGNAHGRYKGEPKLHFDVLKEISELADIPLVLHGGTGISAEDFRKAITLGITKINVATANFEAFVNSSFNYFKSRDSYDYFSLNESIVEEVFKNTVDYIDIFNNK